jgi:hypothetical protein
MLVNIFSFSHRPSLPSSHHKTSPGVTDAYGILITLLDPESGGGGLTGGDMVFGVLPFIQLKLSLSQTPQTSFSL